MPIAFVRWHFYESREIEPPFATNGCRLSHFVPNDEHCPAENHSGNDGDEDKTGVTWMDLDPKVFGVPIRRDVIHDVIRWVTYFATLCIYTYYRT